MSTFEDVWYTSNDGLTLYARDYPNPTSKLTVMCLHGLTRNSADFEPVADALNGQYRIVVPDQRGRGRSAWDTTPANYTPATYVADMFTLTQTLGLQEILLLGTSMGGLMSMAMVSTAPTAFKGVILNDIGPEVATAGLERIKSYVGQAQPVQTWDDAIDQVAATNGVAFPNNTRADWARWAHRMYRENSVGQLALAYDPAIAEPMKQADTNAVPPDAWPLFDTLVDLPLMTIRGELSDILDEACVAEMSCRHPQMVLHTVAQVGHAPTLEEPGVLDRIEAFIGSV